MTHSKPLTKVEDSFPTSPQTKSFQHLSYNVRWASWLDGFHLADGFHLTGSGSRTHWEWASSWKDLRELVAWTLKFDIEQPSIVLNPLVCLHLVSVCEPKFTSIIAYTILTDNVLVCAVHLFGDTETPSSSHHASLLQEIISFEPCILHLCSFVHLFIPLPGFRSQLVVLGETADFKGSTRRTLKLSPSWLNAIFRIGIGNCYCNCSSRRFLTWRPTGTG